MDVHHPRGRVLYTYVAIYLVFAATTARAVFQLEDRSELPLLVGFLALYLLLLLVEPFLISRKLMYLHIINGLQTAIPLVLLLFIQNLDYFCLLFIPPCIQSILHFSRKVALYWIGAVTLIMVVTLLKLFPFSESIGYVIIYPAAIFLFSALSYLAKQAEEAQGRSELLLVDLQKANQKLQAYNAQVEELSAANERNRLARELHDSVTQIIFGLTLSAQAARILIDRDPGRAAAELDHLQVLAQSALTEMRALIHEMHPNSSAEEGLVPLLRRLAAERQSNDGITVDLQLKGERRLPRTIESELFRIAQEGLNNIAKHAHVDHAVITLDLEDANRVSLGIEDAGIGFDPAQVNSLPGHLGLTSMQERVQALGGTLVIDSQPNKGTHLRVEITLKQEVEHA